MHDANDVTIRPEGTDDHAAIAEVINAAFAGEPYADGNEADIVEALRRANALTVSLVAALHDVLVGQVTFSPARSSDDEQGWFALGPVSVLPAHQRMGIGSALIRAGLEAIVQRGAIGCVLVGSPAYYARFEFTRSPSSAPPGQPLEFFMVKTLGHREPGGTIHFHAAFGGED